MPPRSDKLAHEAEQIRKELAATIEELRYRTSRAYFVDQLAGLARGVGSQIGSDLRHNLRKNPLPFTLLGAGAALLALKPQWARTGAREPAGAPGPQMTPGEPGSPLASSRKTKAEQTARPTRQTLTSAASESAGAGLPRPKGTGGGCQSGPIIFLPDAKKPGFWPGSLGLSCSYGIGRSGAYWLPVGSIVPCSQ